MRAESAVEPTKSENITLTCLRSAVSSMDTPLEDCPTATNSKEVVMHGGRNQVNAASSTFQPETGTRIDDPPGA